MAISMNHKLDQQKEAARFNRELLRVVASIVMLCFEHRKLLSPYYNLICPRKRWCEFRPLVDPLVGGN